VGEVEDQAKWVLVVDDEPAILDFISAILITNGHKVLTAKTGMEALEKVRGHEKDIVLLLTDVVMPDLNGPHLAEQMSARIPSLRVLFMSGWEPNVIAHEGAFRRGYKTLAKPFSAAALIDAIGMVMRETPASGAGG
jgi:two-component system, cell cycle sensor histidine kinase and response regulator CckA